MLRYFQGSLEIVILNHLFKTRRTSHVGSLSNIPQSLSWYRVPCEGFKSLKRIHGFWGTIFRGSIPLTASAMALMCTGVVPQHPPMIFKSQTPPIPECALLTNSAYHRTLQTHLVIQHLDKLIQVHPTPKKVLQHIGGVHLLPMHN